jgi:hypothetical protein
LVGEAGIAARADGKTSLLEVEDIEVARRRNVLAINFHLNMFLFIVMLLSVKKPDQTIECPAIESEK